MTNYCISKSLSNNTFDPVKTFHVVARQLLILRVGNIELR